LRECSDSRSVIEDENEIGEFEADLATEAASSRTNR
jgi:hypothetical protein